MGFEINIKEHLANYKQRMFPDATNGYWTRSNPPKELNYAFEPKDENLNLLQDFKDEFLNYERDQKAKIKRHIYFHHLNSSQAMCFNFFYPLLATHQLDYVTDYFGHKEEIDYSSVCFEKESDIDNKGGRRPTNFDFYFRTLSGKQFFFEIKYTEQDFGKAPKDKEHLKQFAAEHLEKYNAVYKDRLNSIKPEYRSTDAFLNNYQIMRNLIHADKNAYVVFLYPGGNEKIKQSAVHAKSTFVADHVAANVYCAEWEDLYDFVAPKLNSTKLLNQYKEFREKYFLEDK